MSTKSTIRSQSAPAPTTRATATIASTPSTTAPTSRRLGSATRGRFSPRGQLGFIVMFTRELTLGFLSPPYVHAGSCCCIQEVEGVDGS